MVVEHLFGDDVVLLLTRKRMAQREFSKQFLVNLYHTASTILVNGTRVVFFENKLFKPICEAIKTSCSRLSVVNEQIVQVSGLDSAVVKALSCNRYDPRSNPGVAMWQGSGRPSEVGGFLRPSVR